MLNDEYSKPAHDDAEAEERYKKFKENDPFPEIVPALLNSADFIDYAVTTGMIFPFNPAVGIKPASYEVELGDEVLYWDDENKRKYNIGIADNEKIIFSKNSITFVTVAARFRLPDYMALRFNLQIHHVHRGLLLGTGPLVDPGFNGKLMIPIHNLTDNDYVADKNEGLICIEFTKLSGNERWEGGSTNYKRIGAYKRNSGEKDNKTFLDYINRHVPDGIVRSSLLATLSDTRKALCDTEEFVEKVKAYTGYFSLGAALATVVLVIAIISLITDANKYVADAENTYKDHQRSIEILLDSKKKELPAIREELIKLRGQLDAANKKILDLEKPVQPSKSGDEGNLVEGG